MLRLYIGVMTDSSMQHIRTSTGETSQPIAKLYQLEISERDQTSICKAMMEDSSDSCKPVPSSRKVRKAAVKVHQHMAEWSKELGPPGSVKKM